jgi:hypothetical protein
MTDTKVAQIESLEYPNGSIESKWEITLGSRYYPVTLWGMPTDDGLTWSYMTSHLREEGAAHGFSSLDSALDDFISRLEHLHRPLTHRLFGKRHAPRRHVHALPNSHLSSGSQKSQPRLTEASKAD